MEGVHIRHSKVHEEIRTESSIPKSPLAPGQVADPTSVKRGEDFPEEWAKRQAKLARQAREAVRKFNEDSAASAATEAAAATEASAKLRKAMLKKPARKPS